MTFLVGEDDGIEEGNEEGWSVGNRLDVGDEEG
jgi:hypothetical protein